MSGDPMQPMPRLMIRSSLWEALMSIAVDEHRDMAQQAAVMLERAIRNEIRRRERVKR
jgi:hypothetical protein